MTANQNQEEQQEENSDCASAGKHSLDENRLTPHKEGFYKNSAPQQGRVRRGREARSSQHAKKTLHSLNNNNIFTTDEE
jgi:hypothetical protein